MITIPFNVTKISILHHKYGPDHVLMQTEYPSPMPKCVQQPLCIKFETEAGTAEKYLRENFSSIIPKDVEITIINF